MIASHGKDEASCIHLLEEFQVMAHGAGQTDVGDNSRETHGPYGYQSQACRTRTQGREETEAAFQQKQWGQHDQVLELNGGQGEHKSGGYRLRSSHQAVCGGENEQEEN